MKISTLKALALTFALAPLLTACSGDSEEKQAPPPTRPSGDSPLAFGAVDMPPMANYLERPLRDEIFYFVLPDRFNNGDSSNDQGDAAILESFGGYDPTDKAFYHGGDLSGLQQKLDYLEGLGVTALWMTPLSRNQAIQARNGTGYHGYWILDFTEIDPHWGGDKDLKALIDEAHKRNMKVFFDIIVNHTADVIRYHDCHDDKGDYLSSLAQEKTCRYLTLAGKEAGESLDPFILKGQENIKTPKWLNDPKYYNNQGDSTWEGESSILGDFMGLDDIDTSQPEVADRFAEIYNDLIDKFKPDGFRIDTVRHVDLAFWQRFTPQILKHARENGIPQFTVYGEVADPSPKDLSVFTRHGSLPSVLDFGIQDGLKKALADGQGADELKRIFADDDYFNRVGENALSLMTFTGNHDMGRLGYFLKTGEIGERSDPELVVRSALAHSLAYFVRGAPIIYYGDEQGFTGDGNDQDSREDMFASQVDSYNDNDLLGTALTTAQENFDTRHPLYEHIANLSALYRYEPALARGYQVVRDHVGSKDTLVVSRILEEDPKDVMALFNFGEEPVSITLPAWGKNYVQLFGPTLSFEIFNGEFRAVLPGLSASVVKAEKTAPRAAPAKFTASAHTESSVYHGEFVVVEFDLEQGDATKQKGPLRMTTTWVNGSGDDLVVEDTSAPYRAIFPISEFPTEPLQLKVVLDNFSGDQAVVEKTLELSL